MGFYRRVYAHLMRIRLMIIEMAKKYYTYILTHDRNHIFYVGITNNIVRRMSEHKEATYKTHVGYYNIKKLVYYEVHKDVRIAIKREKTIKKWKRQWKIDLITSMNPEWRDLSLDFNYDN